MENLDGITVSGASLAALFQSAASSRGDFDGFLLGIPDIRHTASNSDTADNETTSIREAIITEFACFSSPFTFYNHTGELQGTDVHSCNGLVDRDAASCLEDGSASELPVRFKGSATFRRGKL
jgi:hypothetical protein